MPLQEGSRTEVFRPAQFFFRSRKKYLTCRLFTLKFNIQIRFISRNYSGTKWQRHIDTKQSGVVSLFFPYFVPLVLSSSVPT